MKNSILGLCVIVFVSSCTAPTKVWRPEGLPGGEPEIRVLLAEGREDVTVSASGGLTVSAAGGMTLLESGGKCAVRVSGRFPQIELALDATGGVATAQGEVKIVPHGASALVFGNTAYAGSLRLRFDADAKLVVVNTLPLETYLEGVLPHEMGNPGADGYDALKSQAVAARTYALDRVRKRSAEPFHVYASVQDQVYQGLTGRTRNASSAVKDTWGMVMSYGNGLVKAYYCACCGGHTSDIRLVWPNREPAEYLIGIPDCGERTPQSFCRDNRYFRWRYSFSGKELGDMLRKTLPKTLGVERSAVGELLDIEIERWTRSGRVDKIVIRTTKNEFAVSGDQIRWVLLADPGKGRILPSIMFDIDKVMEGGRVAFVSFAGGGNGHGVGMCQSGAIAMSKKGYTYRMILQHYYPGCDVVRAYS